MRSHSSFRRRYAAVDWAQNLRSLPGSLILRRIKSPLLFNIGITSLICLLHSLYGPWPAGIALPHTLLSSALGLLLVFRTNAACMPRRPRTKDEQTGSHTACCSRV